MTIRETLEALCTAPPLSWRPWNLKQAEVKDTIYGAFLWLVWQGLNRDGRKWGVRIAVPVRDFGHDLSPERHVAALMSHYYRVG